MTNSVEGKPSPGFLPARFSRRIFRLFLFVIRKKMRKDFHAVWMTPGTREIFEGLGRTDGPIIMAMNHVSWWDPLVGMLVQGKFIPDHVLSAPMDSTQLVKFGFFRRIGIFGINPDDPGTLEIMNEWVAKLFKENPRAIFWIMPQGEFKDVREPVRPRPGIATNAASHPEARVYTFSMEYTFWNDSRPELCIHSRQIEPPERITTPQWHKQIKHGMQASADELAALVRTRDEQKFDALVPPAANRINPLYDLWLKIRGKKGDLDVSHRAERKP